MRGWVKGLYYGVVIAWLVMNALLVLPATGEGFVSLKNIFIFGAIWFVATHFAFFLTLGWSFDRLVHRQRW